MKNHHPRNVHDAYFSWFTSYCTTAEDPGQQLAHCTRSSTFQRVAASCFLSIDQTFKDNPMLKAQMMKSAAEEWYEEGLSSCDSGNRLEDTLY